MDRSTNFMTRTLIVQQLRQMIGKWDCIKIKNFCTAKETFNTLKRQPVEWEKNFTSYTFNKGLITRMYREFKRLTPQESTLFSPTHFLGSFVKIQMAVTTWICSSVFNSTE
jgi:hypothetical protein